MSELRPCGTEAAYRRHRNHGEDACELCLIAHRDYTRNSERGKVLSRARHRALSRLQDAYPDSFQIFFAEELAKESRAARAVPDGA